MDNKNYKKELKYSNYSFAAMLFSSSFVLMLAIIHSYKGLDEAANLYMISILSYGVSFYLRKLNLKSINNKYFKKPKQD